MLNMQGQVARCYAQTCFQKFVTDNLQRLRGLPESELLRELKHLKINLQQGFVATGMGDLQKRLWSSSLLYYMLCLALLCSIYRQQPPDVYLNEATKSGLNDKAATWGNALQMSSCLTGCATPDPVTTCLSDVQSKPAVTQAVQASVFACVFVYLA